MRYFKILISIIIGLIILWFLGFVAFAHQVLKARPVDAVDTTAYVREMFNPHTEDFVAYKEYDKPVSGDVKLIAYYLPQFHQFAENNRWHGRGFTEWTNVTKAKPLYAGHYQPKLPIDVGFYDLTHDDVMKRQIELAKNYGIGGFAFYYYWFSGKKLMEKPVYNYLNNPELDFPFCLMWANDNWTKRWDGGNQEVLMEQDYSEGNFRKFAEDVVPFFKDSRYVRVNGRPLFIVYRPYHMGKDIFVEFIKQLKAYCEEQGVAEPYIMTAGSEIFDRQNENPADWGIDAVSEFNLGFRFVQQQVHLPLAKIDDKAQYLRYDWYDFIFGGKMKFEHKNKKFLSIFTAWDNSARKAYKGALIFDNSTPQVYGTWLDYAVNYTKENLSGDERLIFISAWNEWAEGAYLEPDRRYGYAYLDTTRKVLDGDFQIKKKYQAKNGGVIVVSDKNSFLKEALRFLHYGLAERVLALSDTKSDMFISPEDKAVLDYLPEDGNLEQIKNWVDKFGFKQLFVVVPFYEIPRMEKKLKNLIPTVELRFRAIETGTIIDKWWTHWESFKQLMAEYAKYLAVNL